MNLHQAQHCQEIRERLIKIAGQLAIAKENEDRLAAVLLAYEGLTLRMDLLEAMILETRG